jgi:serine protease inhibitor
MKKRMPALLLVLALLASSLLSLSGCGASAQAVDLMTGVKANTPQDAARTDDETAAIADFGVTLFKSSAESGGNTLVSPLSVLCALAMTANGAGGDTRAQMEQVFGLPVEELNNYLGSYVRSLPSGDKYKLSLADSIWLRDADYLSVEQSFLQTNADYYDASVYKAPFDDGTVKDINAWVSDNTDGMIENILDQIPDAAVMYLINALAFDAEWETIYKETQVRDGTFTTEAGEARSAEMMYGTEYAYLEDGAATGFVKYYADRSYAFAALLPNEGVLLSEYVASLTGEGILDTLQNARDIEVNTAIPKFESEYAVEMSDILKAMGMTDAFDADKADFTELGTWESGNIFISRVLHKTYIAVDEKGTKAGAATVVEMFGGAAAPAEEPKTVYLDRPFIYMLIDCETNLPIFIGAMTDIG